MAAQALVVRRVDSEKVGLDGELAAALASDAARGLTLVTRVGAQLSPFLDSRLRAAGATWLLADDAGGYRDSTTGAEGGSGNTAPGLLVETSVRHRAAPGTVLGVVAQTLLDAIGLAHPAVWSDVEPLTEAWSTSAVTAHVRHLMPEPASVLAAGEGVFVWLLVARTSRGIVETTRVLVAPSALPDAPDRFVDPVATAVGHFDVDLMTLVRAFSSPDGGRVAGPTIAPRPLAMLRGPRAGDPLPVPADLADVVSSRSLGRAKVASQLLTFSDESQSLLHLLKTVMPPDRLHQLLRERPEPPSA